MSFWDDIGDKFKEGGKGLGKGFVDFLTGAETEGQRAQRSDLSEAVGLWDEVARQAPSEFELTPSYRYENIAPGDYQGRTATEGVFADRGSIDAQNEALRKLAGFDNETLRDMSKQGFTDAERGQLQEMRSRAAMEAKGQRDAALQALAAQGMRNSGAELAARLGAGQSSANQLASMQNQALLAAQQRALGASQAYGQQQLSAAGAQGNLASGMRAQGFNEALKRSGARDDRDRYNMDYYRNVKQRNVDRGNQGRRDRASAAQQAFNNRTNIAANKSSALQGRGQFEGSLQNPFDKQLARTGEIMKIAGAV